ncbi:MAG TPA: radical SAM protein [Blastocatellia bacterium]|nr:radical SAM protein [Blastocatellia bacterium]
MTGKRYNLPTEYHVFERDEEYLIFDPRNFIWFKTDAFGKTVFEGLAKDGRPEDAARELAALIGASPTDPLVVDYVSQYVQHLIDFRFLFEGEYEQIQWAPTWLERPKLLYLHLTAKCNLKCPYCYNQEHRFQFIQLSRKKDLKETRAEGSKEDFFNIIDEAARLGFGEVKITGGEALLNKDAIEIAARAKSRGLHVNLLTNATLITPEMARSIAKAVDSISISLDSAHPEEHDAVRGRGTHAKVLEAIRMLRDAGVKQIHLNSVVTPVNMDSVGEFLDYAYNSLQAREVTIAGSTMEVDDPADRWRAKEHTLDGEQFRHVFEQERKFYQQRRKSQKELPVVQAGNLRRSQCGVGNGLVSIESNGDVYPCQTMHQPEFLCGNAFESGLEHILATSGLLREMKDLQVDILPECNVCPVRYVCAGGCRKEAYTREGDLTARNRMMCPIYFENAVDQLWAAANIPIERLGEVAQSNVHHHSCH